VAKIRQKEDESQHFLDMKAISIIERGEKKLEEDKKKGRWYESGMAGQPHTKETSLNEGVVNKALI
jgi:hypothetical protein